MDISPEEAKAALDQARASAREMRSVMQTYGAAWHFVVWGLIMILGFGIDHFAGSLPRPLVTWHWLALNLAGNALSLAIGIRMRRVLKAGPRIGLDLIWILFLAYGVLGAFILRPLGFREASMAILLLVLLWLGVMGALVYRVLLWMSLGIAVLASLSYFLLPELFYLCLSLGAGGTFLCTGLVLLRRRTP